MNPGDNTTNENRTWLSRFTERGEEPGRWFLWAPVGLGCGIGGYFSASSEPEIWAGPAGLFVFLLLTALHLFQKKPAVSRSFPVILGGLMVALGFTVAGIQSYRSGTVLLNPSERFMTVEGRVERIERRPTRTRLTLGATKLDPGIDAPLPLKLRVSASKNTNVDIGDVISVRAVIRGPGPPAVPGGFDFRRWSWFQQLGGSGFAVGPVTVLESGRSGGWRLELNRLRDTIASRIREAYPDQAGAIAMAVIVGDRSALSEDTLVAMRASGLAHLLAISGLHLGLLAGTVFFAIRFVLAGIEGAALDLPVKKIAASMALAASLLYVVLAGAPIPTIRAFMMTGLVLLAVLADRSAISMRLVAWAAAVILILQPESMLGPSFQMSFAAVVALVAFYESTASLWQERRASAGPVKLGAMYFLGILITTIIAGSATAPFAWHHFGQVGGFGAIANLAAIPLMAFLVMPFALLGLIAMPFGLDNIVMWPAITGLHLILEIARGIGSLDGAIIRLPALSTYGLLAFVCGGLWLCLWRRIWRHLGWLAICAGIAIGVTTTRPDVLVAGNGKLAGVGFENDANWVLALDPVSREQFTSEQWAVSYGFRERAGFSDIGQTPDFRCDPFGCVLTREGVTVSLVRDGRALIEDCVLADAIIAPIPVYQPRCSGPDRVVDFFSLYRNGTHALYLKDGKIRVETAEDDGNRLWQKAVSMKRRSSIDASDRQDGPEH